MSKEMNDGRDYKPILESAKREKSAEGKCRWIIAMLEILALNHLPHIEKGQVKIHEHVDRSTRKILIFLAVVILILLATHPHAIVAAVRMLGFF